MGPSPFGMGSKSNQIGFLNAHSRHVERRMSVLNQKVVAKDNTKQSFASTVGNTQPKVGREIDLASLSVLGKQGNFPTVKLVKADVLKGLEQCKWALVGRLNFQKTNITKVRAEIDLK
ncbi:hypothetical protein FRX31_021054 [Thalictrum thalictroides]|uniref:Uncharacterized protein n=1 Tax=Thalictrum thalictroides TaxID=46969 RepID=A0A7J6VXN7_THATH|nr:hypothetical protein FRX31_021054 [Thalictrum thalictroides]